MDDEEGVLVKKLKTGLSKTRQSLKRMKLPTGSILNKHAPHFSGITRWGVSKLSSFWNDPFHTLLNLPWGSFILVFFCAYLLQYVAFAFLYWIQGSCVRVAESALDGRNTFAASLWMSSRVASTLGFSEIGPNPDCKFINFCVMLQVIFGSLINFILLGVVFARFSAPFKRASTVRFSKVATVSRHPSGFWALTMRVANLRKHQILQPNIRVMVTAADSINPSLYHHEQLNIEGGYKQLANLELGFPAHVTHVITPESFLYNLSLLEMDTRMMEILVFVDGIDAMTSRYMSARIAYTTSDIYLNEQFAAMTLEMRGKKLGLDFNDFDRTVPALDPALLLDLNETGPGGPGSGGHGLWQLRHQTFRRLAERYAHLGVSHTAAVAAAAAADVNGPAARQEDHDDKPISQHPSGPDGMQKGLLSNTTPSHLPAVASMSRTTSGMPFAVAKAGQQEPDKPPLAVLFGSKPSSSGGGAWIAQHGDVHTPTSNGGVRSGGSTTGPGAFVELPNFQHGQHGGGSAWQQSIPLNPLPVLGAPPLGLAHHTVDMANSSGSASPSYGGRGGASNQFTSPLLANSNMYTLEEEVQAHPDQLKPSLPTSHNPAGGQ